MPENRWQRLQRGAIGLGIATFLVLATLLGVTVYFLFPDAVGEKDSLRSNLVGIAIWGVAIGVGILEAYRHRSRSVAIIAMKRRASQLRNRADLPFGVAMGFIPGLWPIGRVARIGKVLDVARPICTT